MQNLEVAWMLAEIADLLEIKGESRFKIAAYRKAARSVQELTRGIREVYAQGELESLDGIGASLAKTIAEQLETGSTAYLEELREQVPPGLLSIMDVPGVGPKTAALLYRELGIEGLADLEAAVEARKVRDLKGMGAKKERQIVSGLRRLRERDGRTPIAMARPLAVSIAEALGSLESVDSISLAGSLRRWCETVGDIDILAACDETSEITEAFVKLPIADEVIESGPTKSSIYTRSGARIDLRVVKPSQFASALQHFTGSKEHNVRLRGRAKEMGYKINEYGVFRVPAGAAEKSRVGSDGDGDGEGEGVRERLMEITNEGAVYEILDLSPIPPELREDTGEIEAAEAGSLPALVEARDIRGDLHIHTNWSDGVNTIMEMVEAARSLGYQYLAVSDHSKALSIAGGLNEERLAEQIEAIARLNEALTDFRVLTAIEVDIMNQGRLDLSDEILEQLDFVTASIHRGFSQDRDTITGRIATAMENPHVDSIGHLTGRLIGRRDPYAVDVERVLAKAAETGTCLEINASPDRLDLKDTHTRRAIQKHGIKIAINTDAHSVQGLNDMIYGVHVARRGWASAKDILNTMGVEDLVSFLQLDKGERFH